MPTDSNDVIAKTARSATGARWRRAPHPRMPSTIGYIAAALAVSTTLFFALWWMLLIGGDEVPWLPSGLAASVVMLVAVAAREVYVRRAWARYTRELEMEMRGEAGAGTSMHVVRPASVHATATSLRALQQRLAKIAGAGALPEAHLEAYQLCEQYLANTAEMMRATGTAVNIRFALHARRERVRTLQKHHLLSWARGEVLRLTHEAQRRVRVSDKIETAMRALDVIGEASRLYPKEPELRESAIVVQNFIASVKVAHWVEMAERAAFRGRYARAIDRYSDALFYLSRAEMGEDERLETVNRIHREIDLLRARLATSGGETEWAATTPPVSTPEEQSE